MMINLLLPTIRANPNNIARFTTATTLCRVQTFESIKPTTAYQCFVKDYFATHKDKTYTFDKKDARKSWLEASQELRESYKKVLAREQKNHEALRNILGVDEIPDKPKRPTNSYVIYLKKKLNENGGLKGSKNIAILAQEWKTLSDSEKKPYQLKFNEAIKNYKEELIAYESKYVINPPKRPLSASNLYIKDVYQTFKNENPSLPTKDLLSKISKSWLNISNFEKESYQKNSAKEKEKYLKEKLDYEKKTGTYFEHPKPTSSFGLYIKEKSEGSEGVRASVFIKSIAEDWKALSESEKEVYKLKALELREEFKAAQNAKVSKKV